MLLVRCIKRKEDYCDWLCGLIKFFTATVEATTLFVEIVNDSYHSIRVRNCLWKRITANHFPGHYENIWLKQYNGPLVHFYLCYVDDTFCDFNNEKEASLFFNFLNSQHYNIKFTIETETNRILAFLDVCIDSNDPFCLKTSTYRKKTFTGLLTNFFSFISFSCKVGLIPTLVDRAHRINNSLLSFNNDVEKLTHILKSNQFPEYLINRVFKSYLNHNSTSAASH